METSAIKNIILRFHVAFSQFDIFKTISLTLLEDLCSTSFSCNKIRFKIGVFKKYLKYALNGFSVSSYWVIRVLTQTTYTQISFSSDSKDFSWYKSSFSSSWMKRSEMTLKKITLDCLSEPKSQFFKCNFKSLILTQQFQQFSFQCVVLTLLNRH